MIKASLHFMSQRNTVDRQSNQYKTQVLNSSIRKLTARYQLS
uniref:Uncharacterized protein n=1 Tax=Arundo donax TaxID=35708 RepID=A0A0A9F9M9_ARUDO